MHRHKRIAHLDQKVGLKLTPLPAVQLASFEKILEIIEAYLNLFFCEFEQATMMFSMQSARQIANKAEMTAAKAYVYDVLEREGVIPYAEWRGRRKSSGKT